MMELHYWEIVKGCVQNLKIFLPKILTVIGASPAIKLALPGIDVIHLSLYEISLNVIGLKTSSEDCPLTMGSGRDRDSWAPPRLVAVQVSIAPTTLLVHVALRFSPV